MSAKDYLSFGLIFLFSLTLTACDSQKEEIAKEPVIRPVKLITVKSADDKNISRYPAVVGANQLSDLSFQVGGQLLEFPVQEAQTLKKGDLIAKLDQRDFRASLASAKAQYQNAEKEYQRASRLAKEYAIARKDLEQSRAQLTVRKSQLRQAEKALLDTTLYAPFDGVIAQTSVTNLRNISPGETIVKYMNDDSYEAQIDLPASFLANLPKQDVNNNTQRAFIILEAAPDKSINASYKKASLLADSASQTYAVTFSFIAPEDLIVLPGMNATVEIWINHNTDTRRIAVPMSAISTDGGMHYVWIVDKDAMTVSKRAVQVEVGVGETLVVTDGLESNDLIVGAGSAYLSEGMKIREWK